MTCVLMTCVLMTCVPTICAPMIYERTIYVRCCFDASLIFLLLICGSMRPSVIHACRLTSSMQSHVTTCEPRICDHRNGFHFSLRLSNHRATTSWLQPFLSSDIGVHDDV